MSLRKISCLLAIIGMLVLAHVPACGQTQAQGPIPYAQRSLPQKTALLAGATICSLVYTPMKAVYCVGGALTGGLVYLMSAGQSSMASKQIINRSSHGDWFVYPDHLTQASPVRFSGDGLPPPGAVR